MPLRLASIVIRALPVIFATLAFAQELPRPAPGIAPEHTYCGVRRPVMIDVVSSRGFGTVTLQLMDFDGAPLGDAIAVHPGRVDLAEKMPAIWNVRRTAFLQMLDLDQPVGSALVLQPMLSRMVPLTEVRVHPTTGQPHSKIVGWADENDPAMQTPRPASPATAAAETSATTTDGAPDGAEDGPARSAPEIQRLFTGLRIYPETDVVFHTSKGDIRIALKPDEAPNTAWNFLELARGGFYRGITFHRIVPLTANGLPFVIQAGDPTGTGDGGPGYWLPMEDSKLEHDFGVISMARSDDPDSNGSQFFICLSREGTARLDGQYCAFGYAVEGAAVIKAIAEVELADIRAGRPADPPVIRDAEVVPAPARSLGTGRPDRRVTVEAARQPTTRPGRIPR
jgi:peptidyl-prolyl cis-trans isomerase B (cyclophilin B)